jgi:hypothetical protein
LLQKGDSSLKGDSKTTAVFNQAKKSGGSATACVNDAKETAVGVPLAPAAEGVTAYPVAGGAVAASVAGGAVTASVAGGAATASVAGVAAASVAGGAAASVAGGAAAAAAPVDVASEAGSVSVHRFYMPLMSAERATIERAMRLPVREYQTWFDQLPAPVAREVAAVVAAVEFVSVRAPRSVKRCIFSIPALRFFMCQTLGDLRCEKCDRAVPAEEFAVCARCDFSAWCRKCAAKAHSAKRCVAFLSLKAAFVTPYLRGGVNTCANCYKAAATQRCARCRTVAYCSKDCQRADWDLHRSECAAIIKTIAAPASPSPVTTPLSAATIAAAVAVAPVASTVAVAPVASTVAVAPVASTVAVAPVANTVAAMPVTAAVVISSGPADAVSAAPIAAGVADVAVADHAPALSGAKLVAAAAAAAAVQG